jgi:hypothetical protein
VAHGVYYNIKITLKHRDLDSIRKRDEDYRSLPAVISYVKQAYPGKELIVSSPDQFYLNKATLMGYKAVYDYTNLDKTNLKVSAKTVLLVPVFWQDDWLMKGYVERKKPKVIREIAGTTFYVQEIDPQ